MFKTSYSAPPGKEVTTSLFGFNINVTGENKLQCANHFFKLLEKVCASCFKFRAYASRVHPCGINPLYKQTAPKYNV